VRRSDAFVISGGILLLMLVASLDYLNFFDRPNGASRYLILLLPFVAAFWVRARRPSWKIQHPTTGHALVAIMVVLGLAGSLYGLWFRQMIYTPLAIFLSMTTGLLLLLATNGPTDGEVRRILQLLGRIGFIYVVMNFLVNTGFLPDALKYRNATAAFVAMAFAYAYVERRRLMLVVLALLYVGIFLGYPSATQILIAGGTALTLILTGRRASSLRAIVTAGLIVLVAAIALLNLNAVVSLTSSYFASVNKANANSGRLDLMSAGLDEFKESPFVGQLFSADAVATRLRDNKTLPFHDDMVLFLAEGGVLGICLLVGWAAWTEFTLISRYRAFMRAGDLSRAHTIRVLLVMLNAFFIAMPFNPVLEGITRTATIFGVWAIAMSLGRPDPGPLRDSEGRWDTDRAADTPGIAAIGPGRSPDPA